MPRRLWSIRLICPDPECNGRELTSAGVYQKIRQVVDIASIYIIITEYLYCHSCKKKLIGWSHRLLSQLDIGHRSQFPCMLTTMKACDWKVVRLMRQRGLGNSSSQLAKKLNEQHSEEWLHKTIQYLTDCEPFVRAAKQGLVTQQTFPEPPPMTPVPQYRWLMQVYIQDVLLRLDEVKANITSQFGRVLKLDSTKKIVKKLTGRSAIWCTNVGNEFGQVLISVLTAGEGSGLGEMAAGLVKRYGAAGVSPPELMYVDRDCCGASPVRRMFSAWNEMHIRLDIWHFMRRLSTGCTTDSHPLYGLFMRRLSQAIFVWDQEDVDQLLAAKRSEMLAQHIRNPSDADVMQRITKHEMALHCRRSTRGEAETIELISQLIDTFDGDKGRDTLGVPLINSSRMQDIWEGQKKHVVCLQDPPNVQLYIKTGTSKKGQHKLDNFRCARGSTSLECFHLHLNRFIPGTLAHDTVFQAYLLDGLSRWNDDRASDATGTDGIEPHTYSGILRYTANKLGEAVLQRKINPSYTHPRKYTGELIGLEYLYSQTGKALQDYSSFLDELESETGPELDIPEEDEGFVDIVIDDMTIPTLDVEPTPSSQPTLPLQPISTVQAQPPLPVLPVPTEQEYLEIVEPLPETFPPKDSEPAPSSQPTLPLQSTVQAQPTLPLLPIPTEQEYLEMVKPLPETFPPQDAEPAPSSQPLLSIATLQPVEKDGRPMASLLPVRIPTSRPPSQDSSGQLFGTSDGSTRAGSLQPSNVAPLSDTADQSPDTKADQRPTVKDDSVGPDNIAGYGSVQLLAEYLVALQDCNLTLTDKQSSNIIRLWNDLSDYDKQRTRFSSRFAKEPKGRFRATKKDVAPGVQSTERSIRGPDSIPAQYPDCNRIVESVIYRLVTLFPGSHQKHGHRMTRWSLIIQAYGVIRHTVLTNAVVMRETDLQLPEINQTTLKTWHNNLARHQDRQVLHQGLKLPEAPLTTTALLPPLPKPTIRITAPPRVHEQHVFYTPLDTAGTVRHKRRNMNVPRPSAAPQEAVQPAQTTQPIVWPPQTQSMSGPTQASAQSPVIVIMGTPSLTASQMPHRPSQMPQIPYTTQRYRKRKIDDEDKGHARRSYKKEKIFKSCKRCGQPITKETHINYFGNIFCTLTETISFLDWKKQFESKKYGKKK